MSESESDHDDDDINNSLTTANLEDDEISSGRRHKGKHWRSFSTNDDDELEEDLTYSEEGNMNDFIVDDFDASDCEGMSNTSQDESNSDAELLGKNLYSNYDQSSEEDSDFVEDLLCAVIPKRKRTRNVFISESESDDDEEDDDLPIGKLVRNHVQERSADELVNVVDDDADDCDDDDEDDDDMR
ncbi:hypothetical protein MTR_1g028700 [Medicago truncatula]|uniref:Uncharacterized protein n=1 Tax=Medicago truncatula TaxID=3880 RepID=A0A072VF79_MEDTR|nr:hypothetical protein MTR_1g028700 [Medicago truncatula]